MADKITYTGYTAFDTISGQLKVTVIIPELVAAEEHIFPAGGEPPPEPPEIPPGFEDVDYVPVATEQTFEAYWKPDGKNTVAPKLMQGERIKILTYDGVDKFEWSTDGYDKELTRVQPVVTAVTGFPKEPGTFGKHFDSETSYYTRLDPENHIIEVRSSVANEEIGGYHIQIDTATGMVFYHDTFDNIIELNSPEGKLYVKMKEITVDAEMITFNLKKFIINSLKMHITKGTLIVAAITQLKKDVTMYATSIHKAPSRFEQKVLMDGKVWIDNTLEVTKLSDLGDVKAKSISTYEITSVTGF